MTHWRETPDTEDLGEVAFNAFYAGFHARGDWPDLTEEQRNWWRVAANAVAEVVATRLAKDAPCPKP